MFQWIDFARFYLLDNLSDQAKRDLGLIMLACPEDEVVVRWDRGAWRTKKGNVVEPVGYSHFCIMGAPDA